MRIATLADVQDAHRQNRWLRRPAVDDVSIGLEMEPQERHALQARLQALFNDCGCLWGGPAFLLGFIVYGAPRFARTGFAWPTLGAALAAALAAAATAKLLALYASHIRLRSELDRLGRRLAAGA